MQSNTCLVSQSKTRSLTSCERDTGAPNLMSNVSFSTVWYGGGDVSSVDDAARLDYVMHVEQNTFLCKWVGPPTSVGEESPAMDRRRRFFVNSALTFLNFLMCNSVRCTLPQHKSGSTTGFSARAQGSHRIGFAAADLGKLPDGVAAEMLWALPMSHFESAAQCVELMCSDLGFDDSWFRVMASLSPETPPPKSLNTFLPISCLTTLRMLLGFLWMQKKKTRPSAGRHFKLLSHRTDKAFDRISHSQGASMSSCKNVCLQLIAVLCVWLKKSRAVTGQLVVVDRGCRKGSRAPPGVCNGHSRDHWWPPAKVDGCWSRMEMRGCLFDLPRIR